MDVSWQELADGAALLSLDASGAPDRPLTVIDLDAQGPPPAELTPPTGPTGVVVGVTTGEPPAEALPHLTCFADPDQVAAIMATVQQSPVASITLANLLHTEPSTVQAALVAESLAYSTLQSGAEFQSWLHSRGEPRAGTAEEPVTVVRAGDTLTITLNDPRRHNAYSAAMRDGLRSSLAVAVADPDLHVVLRGAGESFCSGGDLAEFGLATDPAAAHLVRLAAGAASSLHLLRDRTRVEVHGACVGAGIELAAFATEVIASSDAWFQLPELGMGLVPGAGGTAGITRRIGRWRTAELALTQRRIDVPTARSWGLVDDCVD